MRFLVFGLFFIFTAFSADARVCFLPDIECQASHFNPDMSSANCERNFKSCDPNLGLIGSGSSCYGKDKRVLYETCICDLTYYKYDASNLGTSYQGVEPYDCSGTKRYHEKTCLSGYKYALATDIAASGLKSVVACPDGFSLGGYSCAEPNGFSSFNRYTNCTPVKYHLCTGEAQIGVGTAFNFEGKAYFTECGCKDGYWLAEDGSCRANGPSAQSMNINYVFFYPSTLLGYGNGEGEQLAKSLLEQMFLNSISAASVDDMYTVATETNITDITGELVIYNSAEDFDRYIQEQIDSGRIKADRIETIKMHQLLSYTGYGEKEDAAEWGLSLWIDAKEVSDSLDLPIMVFSTIYDANLYRHFCAADRDPLKLEFIYAGWLSTLGELKRPFDWKNNPQNIFKDSRLIYLSSKEPAALEPESFVPFASMSNENSTEILGCNPFEHQGEIVGGDFRAWIDIGIDVPELFGGDKCVNHVLKANGFILPSAIYVSGMNTLYLIETEVRAQISDEKIPYEELWNKDQQAPGNFVMFNLAEKNEVCSNSTEADKFEPNCEIFPTLPYFNSKYASGEATADELVDNPDVTLYNNFRLTYLGYLNRYEKLKELKASGNNTQYMQALSSYYQYFWENQIIRNGRYEWSYPFACPF